MTDEKTRAYGLRHQVADYFQRQAEHLLGESRAAADLTTHTSFVGNAGEESVRSFLRDHLPSRYGVGTGHVVSFRGNSAQVDVVIFDSRECFKIPIVESETLFSIEGVYAVIEVKSSPSRQYSSQKVVSKAVPSIASVRKLVNFPFFSSGIPTYTRLSDISIIKERKRLWIPKPVSAILILGTGNRFDTVIKHLQSEASRYQHDEGMPDLLCVLDEKNFGLYGFDLERIGEDKTAKKYWRESCDSLGQTLALFIYWLSHKMTFEHLTEQPIFQNQELKALWPSVMAPVIPRMHVDVSESGSEMSWGWKNETRQFYK